MSGQSGGLRLQDAARDAKRGLILAEAIHLFNRQGYFDTRLEDVADRLETAKTSISYHFKSKEALLAEAYRNNCDFVEQCLADAAEQKNGLLRTIYWLRVMARANSAIACGTRPPLATINDLAGLSEPDRVTISMRMQAIGSTLSGFLHQGVTDGSVTVGAVNGAAFFLINSAQWLAGWLGRVQPIRHSEAIDALIDLFSHGLLADRGAAIPPLSSGFGEDNPDFLFNREARNKMRVEAFIRAGTRHLNRTGYTNLSLSKVAGELGVSRGSFYYYIDDKDALLALSVNRSLELIEKAFARYARRGPAAHALFQIAGSLYQGHVTDLDPLLRLQLLHSLPDSERRIAHARLARIHANFDEVVATGMADGSIRPCAVEAIGEMILGALHGATPQRLKSFGIRQAAPGTQSTPHAAFFAPMLAGIAAAPIHR